MPCRHQALIQNCALWPRCAWVAVRDLEQLRHSDETHLSPALAPASDRTTVDHNAIKPKGSEDNLQSHKYICTSR